MEYDLLDDLKKIQWEINQNFENKHQNCIFPQRLAQFSSGELESLSKEDVKHLHSCSFCQKFLDKFDAQIWEAVYEFPKNYAVGHTGDGGGQNEILNMPSHILNVYKIQQSGFSRIPEIGIKYKYEDGDHYILLQCNEPLSVLLVFFNIKKELCRIGLRRNWQKFSSSWIDGWTSIKIFFEKTL